MMLFISDVNKATGSKAKDITAFYTSCVLTKDC